MKGKAEMKKPISKKSMAPVTPIFQGDPEALLPTAEAALLIGISVKYLRKLRTAGGGPEFIRLSKNNCAYSRKAIRDWVRSRTFKSTSQEKAASRSVSA